MPEVQNIGWPWTDDGPDADEADARLGRLRALVMTAEGSHIDPLYGTAIPEAQFEAPTPGLATALRVHLREKVRIYEPEVFIPVGEDGGTFNEPTADGNATFTFRFFLVAAPVDPPNLLEVDLQRG